VLGMGDSRKEGSRPPLEMIGLFSFNEQTILLLLLRILELLIQFVFEFRSSLTISLYLYCLLF